MTRMQTAKAARATTARQAAKARMVVRLQQLAPQLTAREAESIANTLHGKMLSDVERGWKEFRSSSHGRVTAPAPIAEAISALQRNAYAAGVRVGLTAVLATTARIAKIIKK